MNVYYARRITVSRGNTFFLLIHAPG